MVASEKKQHKKKAASLESPREQVGVRLRRVREEKGMTIEEVVEITKISRSNLRAIEQGLFEELPAPPFTRGLVTLYGNFLEMDGTGMAEEFLLEYAAAIRDPGPLPAASDLTPKKMAEPFQISSAIWAIAFLVALALVLFWLARNSNWNLRSLWAGKTETATTTVQKKAPEAASKPAPEVKPPPPAPVPEEKATSSPAPPADVATKGKNPVPAMVLPEGMLQETRHEPADRPSATSSKPGTTAVGTDTGDKAKAQVQQTEHRPDAAPPAEKTDKAATADQDSAGQKPPAPATAHLEKSSTPATPATDQGAKPLPPHGGPKTNPKKKAPASSRPSIEKQSSKQPAEKKPPVQPNTSSPASSPAHPAKPAAHSAPPAKPKSGAVQPEDAALPDHPDQQHSRTATTAAVPVQRPLPMAPEKKATPRAASSAPSPAPPQDTFFDENEDLGEQ